MQKLFVIPDINCFIEIVDEMQINEYEDFSYQMMNDLLLIDDWTILSEDNQNQILSINGIKDITEAYLEAQ